jgi:hypothetical protein
MALRTGISRHHITVCQIQRGVFLGLEARKDKIWLTVLGHLGSKQTYATLKSDLLRLEGCQFPSEIPGTILLPDQQEHYKKDEDGHKPDFTTT